MARRRRLSAAQRRACLKNLRKARAALKRRPAKRKAKKNPFRKGKVRIYAGSRRTGTVFKRKGRKYIISRLRNGVKVTRPWASHARR